MTASMFVTLRGILPSNPLCLDVGACKGDFTVSLLGELPGATAILFEPTVASVRKLTERFAGDLRVQVHCCALGNIEGTKTFHTYAVAENNSLLNSLSDIVFSQDVHVEVDTLDGFLEKRDFGERVDLVKIDTQGTDLRVLHGAQRMIERFKPIILVEAIFIPLYEAQDSYFELFEFMKSHKYQLAGIFNAHCTIQGTLAFADLLFLQETAYSKFLLSRKPDEFICVDSEQLIKENQFLKSTCEERLALIGTLTRTAEERLELINQLATTAEQRLAVIERLQAGVK